GPTFDWVSFFQGSGAPTIENLNVDFPPFIRAMEAIMVETSLDDIKNYLAWQLMTASTVILPMSFQQETFDFYGKTLNGTKEMRARWKRCVDQVDGNLGDALGQKFVEKTLGEEGKRRTHEMVGGIEKAMAKDLESLDWMNAKTKEQAMRKLHAVLNKVGSKEVWIDYSKVKIARDDPYGNNERASEFEIQRRLAKIGKPVDKTDWDMTP